MKGILLIGLNSGLLGLPLAAPAPAIAHALSQRVIGEPSSPNGAQEESHRAWSQQQEDRVLGDAKLALAKRDATPLLSLYDWDGVTSDAHRSSTQETKELVQRKINSIVMQPKGLGGNIDYVDHGRLYTPNGTVVAHLIFNPNDGSAAVDLPLGMKGEELVILGFTPSSPNAAQGESYRAWSRQEEEAFLAQAKLALTTKDADSLLRLYDWHGVTSDARRSSTQTAKELVQRKIESITLQPKGLGGNIQYIQDGRLYTPNGTVVAHLILKPNDGSAAVDLPLGIRDQKLVILGFGPKT